MELYQAEDRGFGNFLVISNDIIGDCIIRNGFWENHLYYFYSKFIEPTDIILDAGANIGFHTVQFAKLGKYVYAYEPQKIIFNILSSNILLNGLSEKVEQYRLGLSDVNDYLYLEKLESFREKNGQDNYGGIGITQEFNKQSEKIEVAKFDKAVDVIKMDIQGHEIHAIIGMESIISENEPWFMLENYIDQEKDQEVLKLLKSKGYTGYRLMIGNKEDCLMIKEKKHEKIKNYLENFKDFPIEKIK